MKILVIEDDEVTGAYIADGLREEGHSVDLINNGVDGLIRASRKAGRNRASSPHAGSANRTARW